jgi:hypothetical protein
MLSKMRGIHSVIAKIAAERGSSPLSDARHGGRATHMVAEIGLDNYLARQIHPALFVVE